MLRSVKSKFIFFSIALILLTTVLPIYFLVNQLKNNFKDHSEIMLNTTLDIVRFSLKSAMMSGKQGDLKNIIQDISKQEGIYHIRIINKNGKIDFASDTTEVGLNVNDVLTEHSYFNLNDIKTPQKIFTGNIYSTLEPLKNEKTCQNCHKSKDIIAYLDINTGLTKSENNFYTGFSHLIILAWVFLLVLISGLYFIFNKNIYSPLQKLNTALNEVQKGELNTKLKIKRDDEITLVYKQFNDMTAKLEISREQIEQLHYEELQRANRLKSIGELTSQTAHEINNHIAIIMSRIEYLQLEYEQNKNLLKYKNDFIVLLSQINNISIITKNILKYSKKDYKEIKKINLNKIVADIALILKPILKKRNINLENHNIGNRHFIIADEVQINQVLTNLINNSVDAIEEKGTIELAIFENEFDEIVLTVKDSGQGIETNIKEEIFSPFFTTKNSENRTGLGLYIIKKICDNLKAKIDMETEVNKGTSFSIKFKKA